MSRFSPTVRIFVSYRAFHCCEYCKISEDASFIPFQIDHIISLKHGGKNLRINLAWSCFSCNNNKGSDIGTILLPNKKFVRFFNPREDIWEDHFKMEDGEIILLTEIAEATNKILKLNDIDRIMERRLIYS
jgi:hypothetical protein